MALVPADAPTPLMSTGCVAASLSSGEDLLLGMEGPIVEPPPLLVVVIELVNAGKTKSEPSGDTTATGAGGVDDAAAWKDGEEEEEGGEREGNCEGDTTPVGTKVVAAEEETARTELEPGPAAAGCNTLCSTSISLMAWRLAISNGSIVSPSNSLMLQFPRDLKTEWSVLPLAVVLLLLSEAESVFLTPSSLNKLLDDSLELD